MTNHSAHRSTVALVLTLALAAVVGMLSQPIPVRAQAPTVVSVDARNESGTRSGVSFRRGDAFTIAVTGQWCSGGIKAPGVAACDTAAGIYPARPGETNGLTFLGAQIGALLGRIGGTTFYIGTGGQFTAPADGELVLLMNDYRGTYGDNSGSVTATVLRSGGGPPPTTCIAAVTVNPCGGPIPPPPTAQCPTQGPARQLFPNQTGTGIICPAGHQDVWFFDANQGDVITLVMSGTSGLQPHIEFWGQCCEGAGSRMGDSSDNGPTATYTTTLGYSGRSAIRVGSRNSGTTGNYTLALTIVSRPPPPPPPPRPPSNEPGIPARFFGSVTVNGSRASSGTTIQATVGGRQCASASVNAVGTYSIDVPTEAVVPGCGTSGATVNFIVNGQPANEQGTFQSGGFFELQLTSGRSDPLPPPVMPPPPPVAPPPPAPPPPAPPANVRIAKNSRFAGFLDITWSDRSDNEAGFNIYYWNQRTPSEVQRQGALANSRSRSITFKTPQGSNPPDICVEMTAFNSAGESARVQSSPTCVQVDPDIFGCISLGGGQFGSICFSDGAGMTVDFNGSFNLGPVIERTNPKDFLVGVSNATTIPLEFTVTGTGVSNLRAADGRPGTTRLVPGEDVIERMLAEGLFREEPSAALWRGAFTKYNDADVTIKGEFTQRAARILIAQVVLEEIIPKLILANPIQPEIARIAWVMYQLYFPKDDETLILIEAKLSNMAAVNDAAAALREGNAASAATRLVRSLVQERREWTSLVAMIAKEGGDSFNENAVDAAIEAVVELADILYNTPFGFALNLIKYAPKAIDVLATGRGSVSFFPNLCLQVDNTYCWEADRSLFGNLP